jgi:hypothetical protein
MDNIPILCCLMHPALSWVAGAAHATKARPHSLPICSIVNRVTSSCSVAKYKYSAYCSLCFTRALLALCALTLCALTLWACVLLPEPHARYTKRKLITPFPVTARLIRTSAFRHDRRIFLALLCSFTTHSDQ